MNKTDQNNRVNPENQFPSKAEAARKALCPRCRTGQMFHGSMLQRKGNKMHVNCPNCNLRYEREPGYFYVSMFVSYAFSVAELVIACLAVYLLTGIDDNFWLYMAVVAIVIILTAPFNYRFSRVVLMYWLTPNMRFVPELAQKKKVEV